jgi:hypothetical protein
MRLGCLSTGKPGGEAMRPQSVHHPGDTEMTDIVEEMARSINAIAGEYRIAWSTAVADRMAKAAYTIVERRIGELEFQVAQRGMALAPFAEACLNCIDDSEPDNASTWEHPVGMEVTIRDFREARASLEQRSDQ